MFIDIIQDVFNKSEFDQRTDKINGLRNGMLFTNRSNNKALVVYMGTGCAWVKAPNTSFTWEIKEGEYEEVEKRVKAIIDEASDIIEDIIYNKCQGYY